MSTGQGAVVVLCGWEGNSGSGVAPAIRHRLRGVSMHLRAQWRKEPACTPVWHTCYLPLIAGVGCRARS